MTENDLCDLLRKRYAGDGWAFLPQVPDGTGHHKSRTADAMAMSLWPSAGIELHGFECKVARTDWLKELRNLAKSDALAKYCHAWWVVAPPGVVKKDELPEKWGYLLAARNTLTIQKRAPVRQVKPAPWEFIAGLLRAASKAYNIQTRQREIDRVSYNRGYEDAKKQIGRSDQRLLDKIESLGKAIQEFEQTSGVKINEWNAGQVGDAVRCVLRGDLKRAPELLGRAKKAAEEILRLCENAED